LAFLNSQKLYTRKEDTISCLFFHLVPQKDEKNQKAKETGTMDQLTKTNFLNLFIIFNIL
jgi:hypothetical protein